MQVCLTNAFVVITQIAALTAISQAGYWIAGVSGVPLPGSLIGMLLLLALLLTGVIQLNWIESGATQLVRHLAFFFVPIAVGLLDYADLLVGDGFTLLAALLISAGAGIYSCGLCAQILSRFRVAAAR